jgi:cobalt-zinc-cadmium efflux system outer membrane protein
LKQAEKKKEALAAEIPSQVREARNRLLGARQTAEYYRDVVLPRRKRIVEQTQLHYNYMLQGVYQLLQAQQNLVTAQKEQIEAQRDYWIARIELERVTGARLPVPFANSDAKESTPESPPPTDHQHRDEQEAQP